MRAKRAALVVAAGVLLAVSAGCASSSGRSSGGRDDSSTAAALAGPAWRLTGWSVTSQDPSDFTISAEFKDGRIGGKSAVNQHGGPYTAGDDGSFSVGDLISSMMAGPEPDMKAERTYFGHLDAAKKFRVEAQGNESLIYSRSQASPSP